MDLERKYIGDRMFEIELEPWERMKKISRKFADAVIQQIDMNVSLLPTKNGWEQYIAGVTMYNKRQIFFELEYMNQRHEYPLFIGFKIIDSDTFLDYKLDGKTLLSKFN